MLGQFIKEQRKSRQLTQEFLASELSLSRPTYAQIERDQRDLTIDEAKKLAEIFNISLADLIAGHISEDPKIIVESVKKEGQVKLEIRVTKKDLDKFKQVLLYILSKVGSKPNVGETVIYKLLYFIDFDYYEKFEENLVGATYIKNHHGPTPVEFKKIVDEMKNQGQLEAVKSRYFTYMQKKYLPLKRANLSLLSAREIAHIDDVLARLSDKSAKDLSEYSHEDIPWKTAEQGKPLSYESVFYRDERYSVRGYDDEL